MGVPAERGPPVTRLLFDLNPVTEETPSRDFRITDSHRIGQGGLHEKARDNIAAIRTLKQLEAENRDATDAEKAVLARYAGWGAMPNAFDHYPPSEWKAVAHEVKQLLTDDEFESARASTPNAHFTSPQVITTIWDAMSRLGLEQGSQILEPSLGVGHFFGLMPPAVVPGTKRTGVELDSMTARIAAKLYPDATIFAKGFEETSLPDNFFDAVVGNVPFGDYGVHDPSYKRNLTRAIHDYFFAKSLDKLRPGGVMALITSRYTMDKQDDTIRSYLAERADLLGAIRLPNTAFKANAGTEVTTDILFLQKRAPGKAPSGEAWLQLAPIHTPDGEIAVNEYFARHPKMMLGEMRLEGTMYRGQEPTLAGSLSPALLSQAIAKLPEGAYVARDEGRGPPQHIPQVTDTSGVKQGGFVERDGALFVRNTNAFEPVELGVSVSARVRGMLAVRDAVRLVFNTQLQDQPEEKIVQARELLGRMYGSFVSRYGPLSSRENIRAFAGDPDLPLLLSLENYDAETKRATRTAIFDRRTLERYKPIEHVETAAEALAVCLNETGEINWPRMTALTGHSARQMQHELGTLVYRNPEGGLWETADRYLSGYVREKLKAASAASALDSAYARNVDALKAVQPEDILPGDISARLGSPWIPTSDIHDFIVQLLDIPERAVSVAHTGAIATWTVTLDGYAKSSVSNTTTHGTARFLASDLIEQALNGRVPTAYDEMPDKSRVINQRETIAAREKQQQLKDKFSEWVWKDEQRAARLARDYNDKFNNLRLRTFDGSHLTFPGMAREHLREADLDKHQKDAVWRVLQTGSTLLAHVVGAGKTFEMVAAAMELRRMGLAKKPMIVVPNHLVEQWGAAFLQLYPQANILVAGKDQFSTGNRQKAMSRIATGNYDAVIVSHSSFEKLAVSDDTFSRFVGAQIAELENAITEAKAEKGDTRRIVKEIEKAKKRLTAKIKERADREGKDNTITFEELGVDQVFIDESDLYKNLPYVTKMNRIAGLPNSESNRAIDMFIKTRYLKDKSGGRGVVFATGTPISNTIAEMYTAQRYLAPEMLKACGVEHFDAWAANFGEAVTSLELAPDGSGYRMHTRFAKFVNLPELLSMFRSFADVQTADMLKLPRPDVAGGKPHVVAAPASEDLKAFVQTLVDRAQRLRSGGVDPRTDNMLKITGDGRKAALDMRLVQGFSDPHGDTKLNRAVERIFDTWDQTRDTRSTQLVFCDLSTPNPDKFNVYDELRSKLIERGIPEREIAFIHDADSDSAKAMLFDSVNAGRVRILIGSTEKMGAGTNVQKRLKALHHLDAPWRPRDIEQREGRILRQGNGNAQVDIYRYVTEGSFDAYMWQTLETKARFIQQVMNGSTTVRSAEDLDGGALTYAEIKAIASGNPAVMEKVRVDTEIRKLDQLRSAHINQQLTIAWEVRKLPEQIQRSKQSHERITADLATRDAHEGQEFAMTVGNHVYTGKGAREEAAKALTNAVMSWRGDLTLAPRARFRGFEILSRGNGMKRFDGEAELPELFVKGKETYRAHLNAENPIGTIQSIEHTLRALDRLAEEERAQIERQEKALADYKTQLDRAFEHERRLKDLLARQAQLNAALDLDKNEHQVAQDSADAESKESPHPERGTFVARLNTGTQETATAPYIR
ncbi:MAG: DEAD/DEAH box helicase family protein [Terriglobales bacterium]